ncbi:MAG: exodeoxyribonuclease III, partial [Minisyncoccia bacterium]
MRIISWNVNGIRAVHKKNLFVPFVEKYKPDILCLQETKAQQHQSELDLPNYEEYWNSAEKKGYSGTAIFVSKNLVKNLKENSPINITNNIPGHIVKKFSLKADAYGNPNTEGRVIVAEFKKFFVVSVYTPNSKDDLSRIPMRHSVWDPAFLAYMDELQKTKPVIFCGDLNVAHTELDLARPKENVGKKGFTKEERVGLDNVVAKGFVDTFRLFTKDGGHYSW